ncbi:hypothetical protein ACTXT7_015734 [Hymenolepis weldensis]
MGPLSPPPSTLPPPPHDLSEINMQQRATCCVSLRSRELQAPFLDSIIADSDEKWWILWNNVKRKRQWPSNWFKKQLTAGKAAFFDQWKRSDSAPRQCQKISHFKANQKSC